MQDRRRHCQNYHYDSHFFIRRTLVTDLDVTHTPIPDNGITTSFILVILFRTRRRHFFSSTPLFLLHDKSPRLSRQSRHGRIQTHGQAHARHVT